jgi:hypothetical protein
MRKNCTSRTLLFILTSFYCRLIERKRIKAQTSRAGNLCWIQDMELKAMNIVLAYIVILSFRQDQVSGCPRRRRCNPTNCQWGSWSSWSGCSHSCGNAGVQTRTRSIRVSASCGGSSCSGSSSNSKPCNRGGCHNGGTPVYGRCHCTPGWTGTCCESGE